MKSPITTFITLVILSFTCCATDLDNAGVTEQEVISTMDTPSDMTNKALAQVTAVTVSGNEDNYNFSVTIASPDTGCAQYADWWEVIDTKGNLIYRRILAHSHVEEQPFTRSGGPIAIKADTEVYVRAHMNTSGYGTVVFKGTVEKGLSGTTLDADFAGSLAQQQPLPTGCAF
ncbi:hypothetical protein [Spongiimicrobium salis]|uniref:hypothetical protein n=1 Tax=Spongiimicrobium salis TaxID=1667022 RepID=UPI00374DCA54